MLENYEKLVFRIKNELLSNENIRKLLFYNSEDALNKTTPTKQELIAKNYIFVKPLESISEASLENNQATFISILIPRIDIERVNTGAVVKISIATSNELWHLEDNQMRLFRLGDEIYRTLNDKVLGTAGHLECFLFDIQVYTANYVGYDLAFTVTDETRSTVEF